MPLVRRLRGISQLSEGYPSESSDKAVSALQSRMPIGYQRLRKPLRGDPSKAQGEGRL